MGVTKTISVEDLLASLKKECEDIFAGYPAKFEQLGRVFFRNREAPGCWPVQEIVGDIETMGKRQAELTSLQEEILEAVAKL